MQVVHTMHFIGTDLGGKCRVAGRPVQETCHVARAHAVEPAGFTKCFNTVIACLNLPPLAAGHTLHEVPLRTLLEMASHLRCPRTTRTGLMYTPEPAGPIP